MAFSAQQRFRLLVAHAAATLRCPVRDSACARSGGGGSSAPAAAAAAAGGGRRQQQRRAATRPGLAAAEPRRGGGLERPQRGRVRGAAAAARRGRRLPPAHRGAGGAPALCAVSQFGQCSHLATMEPHELFLTWQMRPSLPTLRHTGYWIHKLSCCIRCKGGKSARPERSRARRRGALRLRRLAGHRAALCSCSLRALRRHVHCQRAPACRARCGPRGAHRARTAARRCCRAAGCWAWRSRRARPRRATRRATSPSSARRTPWRRCGASLSASC